MCPRQLICVIFACLFAPLPGSMRQACARQLQEVRRQLSKPSRMQAGLLKELYSSKQYGSLLGGGGMGDSGKEPQLSHLSLGHCLF